MTPQQLRNSILQLAIQGKLVEQRSEEGTAEELYKQVQAEKKQLIKEGKIKKEKTLPEIEEKEIPFELPENWKWVRLQSIVYNRGQIVPTEEFSYIDIGSIDNKHQKLSDTETIIKPENAPSRARKIIEYGDVIYSTVRPYLHNMCIIDKPFKRMPIASTGFAVMTCHTGVYNKFLLYYLLSPTFDSYANHTQNAKGMAYPAINNDRLYRALIALPPLSEQKRIVAKLEELMPLVDRYEEAWTKLEAFNTRFPVDMQNSILQMAVEGKLVEQRPEEGTGEELYEQIQAEKKRLIKEGKITEDKQILPAITEKELPFDIPVTWMWCRLGDFCTDIFSGKTPKYSKTKNDFKIIGQAANQQAGIDYSQLKYAEKEFWETMPQKFFLHSNDVLLNTLGKGTIGRSGRLEKFNCNLLTDGHLFVFRTIDSVTSKFLYFYLQSKKTEIEGSADGSTNQKFLSLKKTINWMIPLPPLAEQKRIVAKLEELLPLCERLKS